jgi:hypothetical protein
MRALLLLAALCEVAHADVGVSGALGAGAQGDATYGAVDVTLTATWPGVRLGLGARGVWDDGVFRRADWSRPQDVVTVVRDAEAAWGPFAIAAGRLAPAHVAQLADGYRATLDDRWRTGVRAALTTDPVTVGAEVDDVLGPALLAAAARWQVAAPWAVTAAVASDPSHVTAVELGGAHRSERAFARLDLGGAFTYEKGPAVVAFADAMLDRDDIRYAVRADALAGESASAFGPLYRVERLRPISGHTGLGAGLTLAATARTGWVELALRERPGLGGLAALGAGAPMGKLLQAGAWAAVSRTDAAGAAEVRVAWAKRLFSAVQAARFYRLDAMPAPVWSLTAWFGATSD